MLKLGWVTASEQSIRNQFYQTLNCCGSLTGRRIDLKIQPLRSYELNFFKWAFLFKVLARKHAVSMYFGSLLREPIDQVVARQPTHFLVIFLPATTKKLRIVALLHGDNPQLFLFTFLLVTRMSCGSSP